MASTDWSQYFNTSPSLPGTGSGATGGANPIYDFTSGFLGDGVASALDPIGGFVSGLFGGSDKPSWKPYTDSNGNYVWADPRKKNPVPTADVPGASKKPNRTYVQTAGQIQAMQDLFPYLAKTLAGQIIPQQQAQLAAAQATSGGYDQLMTDLFRQYGPQLNQIGNDISKQNMMAQAENENAVLQGPGKDEVASALQLQQMEDPEYFKTRALTSDRLGDLMKSIDLTGGLSSTENRQISQGLAQQGNQRGTANAPSNLDTVGNAMQYGNAGRQRVLENQSALSNAIQSANQFLPASKTGADVFQVATGRSSQPNQGAGNFAGVNNTGGQTLNTLSGLGAGFQNNTNALQQTNNQIASQKKDWLDQFVQFTQGLSNVTSSVGSIAGLGMT